MNKYLTSRTNFKEARKFHYTTAPYPVPQQDDDSSANKQALRKVYNGASATLGQGSGVPKSKKS